MVTTEPLQPIKTPLDEIIPATEKALEWVRGRIERLEAELHQRKAEAKQLDISLAVLKGESVDHRTKNGGFGYKKPLSEKQQRHLEDMRQQRMASAAARREEGA